MNKDIVADIYNSIPGTIKDIKSRGMTIKAGIYPNNGSYKRHTAIEHRLKRQTTLSSSDQMWKLYVQS